MNASSESTPFLDTDVIRAPKYAHFVMPTKVRMWIEHAVVNDPAGIETAMVRSGQNPTQITSKHTR